MNILAIGDLVGNCAIKELREKLPIIRKQENIDFVIVNGENVAEGMGMTEKNFNDILAQKVNCITMGNHTWGKKDIFKFIDHPQIIRPANYSKPVPGKGYNIFECKGKKIAVINLIGRVSMNVLSDNPFLCAKDIVEKIKSQVDYIIVDFHGEATAEKIAFSYYMDGKVTAIYGTHTHVQTADEKILPNGTGYITDIGMTGPINSVIGMSIDASVKRFETSLPEKYKIADGKCKLCGIIFQINEENDKISNIKRIQM